MPDPWPPAAPTIGVKGDDNVVVGGSNFGDILITRVSQLWPRNPLQQAALVLLVSVLLLGAGLVIVQFVRPLFEPPPIMVGGSVHIAVGRFEGVDSSGRALDLSQTDNLADSAFKDLQATLNAPGKPSAVVWSSSQTREVAGGGAERRARQINADIIVYGVLRVNDDATWLQPRFYISSTQLKDAEELAGEYNLGHELFARDDFTHSGATLERLKNDLVPRMAALEDVIWGLDEYRQDDFEAAAAHFRSADKNPAWSDSEGKEIVYLFAGFTAGKLNRLDEAATYFDNAAKLSRTGARAQLGSAETLIQQAGVAQSCTGSGVDVDRLHRAAGMLQAAGADPTAPAAANISPKVEYGLAQIALCLSQSGRENQWSEAEQHYSAVIAAYDGGNKDLRDLAAESHAGLGFIAQPFANESDPEVRRRSWQNAASEYQLAIELGSHLHPTRRAFWMWELGLADERAGNVDSAKQAYASAAHMDGLDAATRARYQQDYDRLS